MHTDCVDDQGNTFVVVHLWGGGAYECNMCGTLGPHSHSVPWYCGPVMEGESEGGYKGVCQPCHDRWAAWNDVNHTPNPPEYRDYYCANPGDAALHELARLGMVSLYSTRGGYEWWTTTDAGKAAARASQKAMLLPKPKRIYRCWLSISDSLPDLTFRDFLTRSEFAESRRAA